MASTESDTGVPRDAAAADDVSSDTGHEKAPASESTVAGSSPADKSNKNVEIDPRTWFVFVGLILAGFCVNLNATVLTTVLPLLTRELDVQGEYVWINASYNVAMTAVTPFFGQISNILGRRIPMLASLALFTLGSGICGGAGTSGALIAGRAIQGAGSGGVMMLLEVITADLFPLRIRPKYFGIILAFCSLGVTMGPIIGGAIAQQTTWRWAFYISVICGGCALVLAVLFLRLKTPKSTLRYKLLNVDIVGNTIFIASICALLVGLIMGGQSYPWSSYHIIVPIVLGVVGLGIFVIHQASSLVKEPTMPLALFSNRTASTGFALIFLSCLLLDWVVYYLPFYFQTLQQSSTLWSGVQVLPFNIFLVPVAGVNGFLLTKFGQYKPLHWIGFGMTALGFGLLSTLDSETSTVKWVFWQIFTAYGLGSLITIILPAIQASLPESLVATSTGLHAFFRSFGFIWAFTVPSLIFNNRLDSSLDGASLSPSTQAALSYGKAFGQANSDWFRQLPGPEKDQVVSLYTVGLQDIWYGALAFSLLGFLLVFIEKKIPLRESLETEFGLEQRDTPKQEDASSV